jgi:hypothetical protein
MRKIRNRLVHTPMSGAGCVGSIGACTGRVRLGLDAREWSQSPSTVRDLDKDINIPGTFVLGPAPPTTYIKREHCAVLVPLLVMHICLYSSTNRIIGFLGKVADFKNGRNDDSVAYSTAFCCRYSIQSTDHIYFYCRSHPSCPLYISCNVYVSRFLNMSCTQSISCQLV